MEDNREALIALRSGKTVPINGNGYWSEQDRNVLKQLYEDGTDFSAIALKLGRTEVSVYCQAFTSNLFAQQCKPRSRGKRSEPKCLCPNCECKTCPYYGKDGCKNYV